MIMSLLLSQILLLSGLVLLYNGVVLIIQSSLVTSVLLDELVGLTCILPCVRLGAVFLDKLSSYIHAPQTQPLLLDESGGSIAALPLAGLPPES